jgi:dTDP-4-amino-4,6-dideoxygalactose transaminase
MISVFGSLVGDEEVANVTDCMLSQWTGLGKNVELFEKKYSEKYGLRSFAMVDSGSNALLMAIRIRGSPVLKLLLWPGINLYFVT